MEIHIVEDYIRSEIPLTIPAKAAQQGKLKSKAQPDPMTMFSSDSMNTAPLVLNIHIIINAAY